MWELALYDIFHTLDSFAYVLTEGFTGLYIGCADILDYFRLTTEVPSTQYVFDFDGNMTPVREMAKPWENVCYPSLWGMK